MKSEAMAVDPSQVGEAMEFDKKHGLSNTRYDSDGRPEFASAEHRKSYCEAWGYYDRNGGYGDPRRRKSYAEQE